MVTADPALFFQLAAALIPALLLISPVRTALLPTQGDRREAPRLSWRQTMSGLFLPIVLLAETSALAGALGSSVGTLGTYAVALALLCGAAVTPVTLIVRWITFRRQEHARRDALLLMLAVAVLIAFAARWLDSSVQLATTIKQAAEVERDYITSRDVDDARQRVLELSLRLGDAEVEDARETTKTERLRVARAQRRQLLRTALDLTITDVGALQKEREGQIKLLRQLAG